MTQDKFDFIKDNLDSYLSTEFEYEAYLPSAHEYRNYKGELKEVGTDVNKEYLILTSFGRDYAIHYSRVKFPVRHGRVYNMAVELLKNEVYDLQEEFTDDEIASTVSDIVKKLNLTKGNEVCTELSGNQLKVRNSEHNSFVSFSTGEYTGLSKSMAEITDIAYPITEEEVKTLIEMINEAWFLAVA